MKNKLLTPLVFALASIMMASAAMATTETIRPDANGNYATWSSVQCGTNDWQCVDESVANTTDNIYSSSNSVKETFKFSNLSTSSVTINNVTMYYYAKYYSSSKNQIEPMTRSGSTDYLSGTVLTLTSSYATYSKAYATNPATGSAWTVNDVNDLQAGMRTYSSKGGAYVAQVYAVVDYTIVNSCSDTDGGNVIGTFGTTSGYYSGNPYSDSDYCVDSSNIMEYYCNGALETSQQQSCGTDSYGSNYCMSGDVYIDYTDYSCSSGACSSSTTPELVEDCVSGQYCSGGACYWNNTCSDTDGGNYKNVFGTASGVYYGSPFSNDDYCVDDSNVMEYWCTGIELNSSEQNCGTDAWIGSAFCQSGDVYRNYTDYYCGSGRCSSSTAPSLYQDCVSGQYCSYGSCYWNDTCSDTDGGFFATIFGTVSGYRFNSAYSYDDTCLTNTTLREYYCSGNRAYNSTSNCATNTTSICLNGACV